MVYYNEIDPFAAQWLRNLGAANHIPQGAVDERSIKEVRGADLARTRQAHFFSGIGGWPLALRLAGWPEDRQIWTGSCPCQPFSSAGKGGGVEDERHLWPEFFRLIKECRPATVMGEQVASKAGLGWLDGVFADLEGEGYACWAADTGAASVGAPHIRQRLYWVADRRQPIGVSRSNGYAGEISTIGSIPARDSERFRIKSDRLQHPAGDGRDARGAESIRGSSAGGCGEDRGLGFTYGPQDDTERRFDESRRDAVGRQAKATSERPAGDDGSCGSGENHWSDSRLIPGSDGTQRRVGRGVFPLAHGIPRDMGRGIPELSRLAKRARDNRNGRLKGYGNAIVPALAAEFVKAFLEATR